MPLSQEAQDAINTIIDQCDSARTKLDAQRTDLGIRRNRLKSPNPPRDLTAAEVAEVAKLDTAITALDDSDEELSVITLEALNDSAGVKELGDNLATVNTGLKSKLEQVQKTAQQLQQVANFIKTLDGITQNLIKLAPLLI
jgi:hypothetical protein